MDLLQFLRDYPEVGTLAIATIAGGIGYLIRSIKEYYIEKNKKRIELQELYWKEKIQAAKKASEYFLHHIGLLNLNTQLCKYISNEKNNNLITSTLDNKIREYTSNLSNFPHFEYYHINLFYKFDLSEINQLNVENFDYLDIVGNNTFSEDDNDETISRKLSLIRTNFKKLETNSKRITEIYEGFIIDIRQDLKNMPR